MMEMRTSPDHFASPEARRAAAHLGSLIRDARLARKITQAELAVRAKTSPATVMRVEKGSVETGLGTVLMLLQQLGLLKYITEVTDPTTQALLAEGRRKRVRRSTTTDLDF
ncbi:helix-turn-helix transcriptional regulator (plasmid) [Xanthomonas citri pv. citri]|uniref:helix-turn-helix domain-containing protein n=1 Tax=Xanthomonas citri TaxID=346 RepID=UPI0019337784|nr:helix-turn-helix transcriptional regulator [Xanthomonas citri]QRD62675.1 helix-turn-helix transcriptional regulator [Xanthomonas citri pv. citri]QRD67210.1 helix-turn-helix transcriptional regulator [Xanthomonas citri pv. citri]QRD71745.1 helix-turn-helix transcriptional regulator [Xanthomonas citri pv. citri]